MRLCKDASQADKKDQWPRCKKIQEKSEDRIGLWPKFQSILRHKNMKKKVFSVDLIECISTFSQQL